MMKLKQSLLILALMMGITASAQDTDSGQNEAIISFELSAYDFGDLKQGEMVEHSFIFQNTGNQALLLSNVLVQCGCTAINWPHDPVEPGATGEIIVRFDTAHKKGMQHKVITVVSNATNSHERVNILANIIPK